MTTNTEKFLRTVERIAAKTYGGRWIAKNRPPVAYELVNRKTTNTFGHFSSEREALKAYEKVQAEDPQLADELLVVAFEENGGAVATYAPSEVKR